MVTMPRDLDLTDPQAALVFGYLLGQLVSAPQARKEIQGAIVAAIDAHGPITRANAGSATKRRRRATGTQPARRATFDGNRPDAARLRQPAATEPPPPTTLRPSGSARLALKGRADPHQIFICHALRGLRNDHKRRRETLDQQPRLAPANRRQNGH